MNCPFAQPRRGGRYWAEWWGLLLAGAVLPAAETASPLPELRTAGQIRSLTAEEADRQYPVRLRGVVSFFDQNQFLRFIQDDTAGIYFNLDDSQNNPPLAAGQRIELEGVTSKGEYAPIVQTRRFQFLGPGDFPAPKLVTFEQLASGQMDSQFVQLSGRVRSVRFDEQSQYYLVTLGTGGERLTVQTKQLPVEKGDALVDSTMHVHGVCVTRFNRQRQLFDIRLLAPRPSDLVVEVPAPVDPFNTPVRPIATLLQFTPQGPYGHRVKVAGTVIYRRDDSILYIQDETEGLRVETAQPGRLLVGEHVEVLGFPAKGEYTPKLEDAVFRSMASGPLPEPDRITADEALKGTYDGRLVRVEATVLDRARHSPEQFLVLQADGFIFHAYLERKSGGIDFKYLENGSKVAVSGVCVIETGSDWRAGETWRAKSFRILMRSAGDVFLLQSPPWWTLQRLLVATGILGTVVVAAFTWVVVLRRRVHKQTGIIRLQLQTEAALKERYEDLFENANDVVFTHDLSGRLTSINKAGERLLGRSRETMLSLNLVDLLVEEERGAARQWLELMGSGADVPPAEWDFTTASGQRLKLEISSRIVEQNGRKTEVEGIARDITERKRLEKEILEISNREQRRIGHDLHDGVCQQLAGIAYRADILADQLRERGVGESTEAEQIGSLINQAVTHTRSVARGLFPVRLEENGLASALEELAANTVTLFKVQCTFSSDTELPPLENGVALHLYCIVQEAVQNAVKHGKASSVVISLSRASVHGVLTVQDDGIGFQPPGTSPTGMGIRIMRYRARVIGATLDLKSQPGHGTEVTCLF